MKCKKVRSILSEMVSGELDAGTYAEAKDHLDTCLECREQMLSYQSALEALTNAWAPVQAPAGLVMPDCVDLNARPWVVKPWFVIAGVCLAVMVTAAIVLYPKALPMQRMQAMCPPYSDRQLHVDPVKTPTPTIKPEPKSEPKNVGPQPESPKWDERRLRTPRRWDYIALKPRLHRIRTKPANSTLPKSDEPATVTVACTPPPRSVVSEKTCTVPSTTKTTRQIITYDRFGIRQVTQVETEEQIPQPCTMALY